jgi:hypothetical protein
MSHSLRKRFVKDYRLPITLLQDPYFDYFIDLYVHMDAREKYQSFVDLVERLGGEEPFFAESRRIIDAMILRVKTRPEYAKFNDFDLSDYDVAHSFNKASPIFHSGNHDKWFISIDLVKANWQSFDYYNPALVEFKTSYEQWARLFTDEPYYLKSKQIRQVVFGNLNPKRQQRLQRFMMDQIWHRLDRAGIEVIGATSDELIIPLGNEPGDMPDAVERLLDVGYDLHVDTFRLTQVGDKSFFKREYLDGSFDLKGVPAHYYAEVLQHVLGNEPTEMDRTSFFEKRVVRFLEPLF